jgi:hypothetical protein
VLYKVNEEFSCCSFFSKDFILIDNLVHTESASTAQIRAVVLFGTRQVPSTTTIINDNLVRIHFIPHEPGVYLVHVSSVNQPIEGIRLFQQR